MVPMIQNHSVQWQIFVDIFSTKMLPTNFITTGVCSLCGASSLQQKFAA